MKTDEALSFLCENQPLPDQPPETVMHRFRAVTLFFYENPDPRCIPLLLNAFGLFDDLTLYESLKSVLARFPRATVVPHLVDACRSHYPSVRFAAADAAAGFPDPALIEPLGELLREGAVLIRLAAAAALETIGGPKVRRLARERLAREADGEILEILHAILADEA